MQSSAQVSVSRRKVFRFAAMTGLFTFVLVGGLMHPVLAQGPQNFIVTFQDGTIPAARTVSVGNAGASMRFNYTVVNAAAVTVPSPAALAALANDPNVLSVFPDRPVFAFQQANKKPDNPGKGGGGGNGGGGEENGQVTPSGVSRVGAPTGLEGFGIGVAVLDSGIDWNHLDLMVKDGVSAFDGGNGQDDYGHGTHVAGIVAARNDSFDVVGVAPGADLYAVKVLDSTGSGYDSDIIFGLNWVLNHNQTNSGDRIEIVNMSLGRPGSLDEDGGNSPLWQAIQAVHADNVTIVTSAGNDPYAEVSQQIPAAYPEVIAVASTTAEPGSNSCRRFNGFVDADTASYFTTDGPGVAISAPGAARENINKGCRLVSEGILSTQLGGGLTRESGTSMAAPHVAGIVARLLEQDQYSVDENCVYDPTQPGPVGAQIRRKLQCTAEGVGTLPIGSPSTAYTWDGVDEGIAVAP